MPPRALTASHLPYGVPLFPHVYLFDVHQLCLIDFRYRYVVLRSDGEPTLERQRSLHAWAGTHQGAGKSSPSPTGAGKMLRGQAALPNLPFSVLREGFGPCPPCVCLQVSLGTGFCPMQSQQAGHKPPPLISLS